MIVTLDLSAEQAKRLEFARLQGVPVDSLFDDFLARLPEGSISFPANSSERNRALIALLERWNQEDSALSPEQESERQRDGKAFSERLSINRVVLPIPDLPE